MNAEQAYLFDLNGVSASHLLVLPRAISSLCL